MSTGQPEASMRLLTSAEVAAKMQVSVQAVYKLRLAGRKGAADFPNPVDFAGRSPLYSEADIDAYIVQRSSRPLGERGRRPRVDLMAGGHSDTFAGRLRVAIATGGTRDVDIRSQIDLIKKLELNTITFGQRMRGQTRWTDRELQIISELVDVDTDDANDEVTRRRKNRQ